MIHNNTGIIHIQTIEAFNIEKKHNWIYRKHWKRRNLFWILIWMYGEHEECDRKTSGNSFTRLPSTTERSYVCVHTTYIQIQTFTPRQAQPFTIHGSSYRRLSCSMASCMQLWRAKWEGKNQNINNNKALEVPAHAQRAVIQYIHATGWASHSSNLHFWLSEWCRVWLCAPARKLNREHFCCIAISLRVLWLSRLYTRVPLFALDAKTLWTFTNEIFRRCSIQNKDVRDFVYVSSSLPKLTMAWQCVDSKRWIKPWTIIYLLLSVIIFAFCSWRNLIQICCVQRAHNDHYHYASPSGREHLWIYVFVCDCVQ